jgi:endoglucanase
MRATASLVLYRIERGTLPKKLNAAFREIRTDALGAVRTFWIGDFTPLQAPGRYRIVTDHGISSYPFDVGPSVFDSAVRAVQRAFYYQRAFTEIDAEHAQGPWIHASDAAQALRVILGTAGCGRAARPDL